MPNCCGEGFEGAGVPKFGMLGGPDPKPLPKPDIVASTGTFLKRNTDSYLSNDAVYWLLRSQDLLTNDGRHRPSSRRCQFRVALPVFARRHQTSRRERVVIECKNWLVTTHTNSQTNVTTRQNMELALDSHGRHLPQSFCPLSLPCSYLYLRTPCILLKLTS